MENFNEYMEDFRSKSIEEKRRVALEQLKLLVSLTNEMCEKTNIKNTPIITKDILEAEKDNSNEDDFVEAVVVYTSSIQESLCDYIDKVTKDLENNKEEENY